MSRQTTDISKLDVTDDVAIILDNGGGITLQVPGYQHAYDTTEAGQVVADLVAYLEAGDASDWEGNELDECGLLEPTDDEIRNGGYRVCYTVADLRRAAEGYGANAQAVCDVAGIEYEA